MRIMGLDYGEKRIGVAVSDPLALTGQGAAVITRSQTIEQDIQELKKIFQKYEGIREIVVGLPKMMSGELGVQAGKVLVFVERLKREFNVIITTWDERLSTVESERMLIEAGLSRKKRKSVIDKTAAAVILQSYLDRRKR